MQRLAHSAFSEVSMMLNYKGILEPRARVELATCRLRKDLTLRMLLWSMGDLKWSWGVSGYPEKQLCSSLCSNLISRFRDGWAGQKVMQFVRERPVRGEALPVDTILPCWLCNASRTHSARRLILTPWLESRRSI